MKKNENGLKSYNLSSKKVEALLQADYGDKIKPVNETRLQKQQNKQDFKKALQDRVQAKSVDSKTGTRK